MFRQAACRQYRMVQAAKDGLADDATFAAVLDLAWLRRVLAQSEMRPRVVVVRDVLPHQPQYHVQNLQH